MGRPVADGALNIAAFDLHQAVERLYHCLFLVRTLYSPKTHNLNRLRDLAEELEPSLKAVWPRNSRFEKRWYALLRDAYVKARYSKHYRITEDELQWLGGCVEELGRAVHAICSERIAELEAFAGQNPPLAPI